MTTSRPLNKLLCILTKIEWYVVTIEINNEAGQIFLERYKNTSFKYSDLIMSALKNQTVNVTSSYTEPETLIPCKQLFRLYAIRTKRPKEFYLDMPELLTDMIALRDELQKYPNDLCSLWVFDFNMGKTVSIFENATKEIVMGGFISNQKQSPDAKNA